MLTPTQHRARARMTRRLRGGARAGVAAKGEGPEKSTDLRRATIGASVRTEIHPDRMTRCYPSFRSSSRPSDRNPAGEPVSRRQVSPRCRREPEGDTRLPPSATGYEAFRSRCRLPPTSPLHSRGSQRSRWFVLTVRDGDRCPGVPLWLAPSAILWLAPSANLRLAPSALPFSESSSRPAEEQLEHANDQVKRHVS